LDVKLELSGCRIFYLVELRTCPTSREGFKEQLAENEAFETEFIGASPQDCQKWALEKQVQTPSIE